MRLNHHESPSQNKVIFIKSGYELIKVNISEIIYIKSDADYTEVVTHNGMLLSNDTLKAWVEELGQLFCQVHKSYLVNTALIIKVSGNQIYLNGDHIIPIGRAFKANFVNRYLISGI